MLKKTHTLTRMLTLCLVMVACCGSGALALQEDANVPEDLFELSIEELMDVEITTVSKKEERLFDTPSAAYVLTAEDIRRSGATSIMEALRMVPGLQVARLNANKWAITSRGFAGEFANKMLVMIDGRSIYTPHFGGVRWDHYDVMLEDVERIEIVRGPGGTLWGANAVNGIINIITKHTRDTQGTLLSGGVGTEEQGFGTVRYGDTVNEKTSYRVYSKYFDRAHGTQLSDASGQDGWDMLRGGFRLDHDPSERDQWTLLGDIYDGDVGQTGTVYSLTAPLTQPYTHQNTVSGGDLLGRWKRSFSPDSDMSVQVYYNRERRLEEVFSESLNTYDVDMQHRFLLHPRHEITWGLGYRLDQHTVDGTFSYSLNPRHEDVHLYSGFVQDRISLVPDRLELTIGSKVLYDEYVDFEFQPGARMLWKPDERNTVWGAVTRAVKIPNRHERTATTSWGVFAAGPSTISQEGHGEPYLDAAEVMAYELGYRTQATDKLILDLTGFFNDYEEVLATERMPNIARPGYTIWPNRWGNNLHGEIYGAEISAAYQATQNWRLSAGYSFLQMQLHPDKPTVTRDSAEEGHSPHNQFHLRSFYDICDDLELDVLLNYVDNLPQGDVPHYIRCDVRLGWHIRENLELSVVGQNLFDPRHPEFGAEGGQTATEAPRAAYLKLTYLF